jgi:hypothetical protein
LPDSELRLPPGINGGQHGRDESAPGLISFVDNFSHGFSASIHRASMRTGSAAIP